MSKKMIHRIPFWWRARLAEWICGDAVVLCISNCKPTTLISGDTEEMPIPWDSIALAKLGGTMFGFGGSGSAKIIEEFWAEERMGPISRCLLGRVNFNYYGTRGYWVDTMENAEKHCARLNCAAGFRGSPGSNAKSARQG